MQPVSRAGFEGHDEALVVASRVLHRAWELESSPSMVTETFRAEVAARARDARDAGAAARARVAARVAADPSVAPYAAELLARYDRALERFTGPRYANRSRDPLIVVLNRQASTPQLAELCRLVRNLQRNASLQKRAREVLSTWQKSDPFTEDPADWALAVGLSELETACSRLPRASAPMTAFSRRAAPFARWIPGWAITATIVGVPAIGLVIGGKLAWSESCASTDLAGIAYCGLALILMGGTGALVSSIAGAGVILFAGDLLERTRDDE